MPHAHWALHLVLINLVQIIGSALLGLLLVLASVAARADAHSVEARALALEKKLLAPCCWQGTLDVHHSPVADALHTEIRARLADGQSSEVIERDLVERHGPRLIAVPSPGLLEGTAAAVMAALALAGALLWLLARSWSRSQRAPRGAPEPDTSKGSDEYDVQLAAELQRLG